MASTESFAAVNVRLLRADLSSSVKQTFLNSVLYCVLYVSAVQVFGSLLVSSDLLSASLFSGLILLLAFSIIRIFIIQHDCAHHAYLKSVKANNYLGLLLSIFTHVPHVYWKQQHAFHHAHSGNLQGRNIGDIRVLTKAEYASLSGRSQLAYKLYRNPFVMVVLGALFQFFIWFKWPHATARKNRKSLQSIVLTNALIVLRIGCLCLFFDWMAVLVVEALSLWLAAMMAIVLFYVQHNYQGTYWSDRERWNHAEASLKGSSFLNLGRVGHWLTGNIGYHHIHHLDSRIPNYHLPVAHQDLGSPAELTVLRYQDIPASFGLKLWDEKTSQLVKFGA